MKLPMKVLRNRANLLLRGSKYRNRYIDPLDRFEPIHHIENELSSERRDFIYRYVPELEYLGCPVEAKVSFQDVVVMHIRDQTLTEARFGVTSARFTLCHEIAHVLLHRRTMNKRLSGAALPRGMNHSSSSFQIHETNADMEREANLFAGALLIPLEAISVKADPNALAKEYGTSPIAAREARLKALEVWWLIEELRNGE